MMNSNNTISEIAGEFGFADSSHFNKFFKQQTGANPLAYRKRMLVGRM
jgi:AraC-like DNA-binding protein